MPFCPICSQCPQCYLRTEYRGKFWRVWQKSLGSLYPQAELHSSLQTEAPFDKVPPGSKCLRQSNKESALKRGTHRFHEQVGSRKSGCQVVPGFLQPSSVSQTQQKIEANLRSESVKCIYQPRHFQDGNSRDNPAILENRTVGHIAGLQRHILPHSNWPKVKELSQVLHIQPNLPIHSSSLLFGHSSTGVHQGGQGGETPGSSKGYRDPPVPRRMVTESPIPGNLPTT